MNEWSGNLVYRYIVQAHLQKQNEIFLEYPDTQRWLASFMFYFTMSVMLICVLSGVAAFYFAPLSVAWRYTVFFGVGIIVLEGFACYFSRKVRYSVRLFLTDGDVYVSEKRIKTAPLARYGPLVVVAPARFRYLTKMMHAHRESDMLGIWLHLNLNYSKHRFVLLDSSDSQDIADETAAEWAAKLDCQVETASEFASVPTHVVCIR